MQGTDRPQYSMFGPKQITFHPKKARKSGNGPPAPQPVIPDSFKFFCKVETHSNGLGEKLNLL